MILLLFVLFFSPLAICVFFLVAATVAIHFLPFILIGLAVIVIVRVARVKNKG